MEQLLLVTSYDLPLGIEASLLTHNGRKDTQTLSSTVDSRNSGFVGWRQNVHYNE